MATAISVVEDGALLGARRSACHLPNAHGGHFGFLVVQDYEHSYELGGHPVILSPVRLPDSETWCRTRQTRHLRARL